MLIGTQIGLDNHTQSNCTGHLEGATENVYTCGVVSSPVDFRNHFLVALQYE